MFVKFGHRACDLDPSLTRMFLIVVRSDIHNPEKSTEWGIHTELRHNSYTSEMPGIQGVTCREGDIMLYIAAQRNE